MKLQKLLFGVYKLTKLSRWYFYFRASESIMKFASILLAVAFIAIAFAEDKEKVDIGTVIGIDLGTTYSW